MSGSESSNTFLRVNQLIPILTAFVGVIGFILPFLGFSYEQGYTSEFGLSHELLQRGLTEYWSYSYYIVLIGASKLIQIYFTIVLSIIAFVLFFEYIGRLLITIFGKEILNNKFNSVDKILESRSDIKIIFNILFSLGVALVLIFSSCYFPYIQGKEQAMNDMKNYQENGCDNDTGWSKCITINDANQPEIELFKGFLITASKKYIALYDGVKTQVILRSDNYVINKNNGNLKK